jgi:hypothetical protein
VGKSSFGGWLAEERDWLHLEVDRYPDPADGITLHNLRSGWDDFFCRGNPKGLSETLQRRLAAKSKTGCVVTFPGNLVLSPDRMIAAARAGIRTIYLYGSAADCITAFLTREQQTGRNLPLTHWIGHNWRSYMQMSEPAFAPFRIHVFTHMCTRRSHEEVFEALLKGEESEAPTLRN